jgi:hypothetical protein
LSEAFSAGQSIFGLKNGPKTTSARKAQRFDCATHGRFIVGGLHDARAMGHLVLEEGGPHYPFASIFGRRNGRMSTVWPMPIHSLAHGFGNRVKSAL